MGARRIVVSAAMLLLVGCASVLGFDDFVAGAPTDAGSDGAPDDDAEADWFVSPTGDDANDGSRERPVRSLRKALDLAQAARAEGKGLQKIAVCTGEYLEGPLEIRGAIAVRGGYDCSSWVREAVDGRPIGDREPKSKLVARDSADAFVGLRGDSTGTPTLDRLSIQADRVTATVVVAGDATLTELFVTNSYLPPDERLITALWADRATLTVESSVLRVASSSVSATNAITASVLSLESTLLLRRSELRVTDLPAPCQGIVGENSTIELEENTITLDGCTKTLKAAAAAIAGAFANSKVRSTRNVIRIDRPANVAADVTRVAGVNVVAEQGVTAVFDSDGDRIVGPAVLGSRATALSFTGMSLSTPAQIRNASIVLDSRGYDIRGPNSAAISLQSQGVLAHNTIYFSPPRADAGPSAIYGIALAKQTPGAPPSASLESNVLATDDPRVRFLRIVSCADPGVRTLANNFYAGVEDLLRVADGDAACSFDSLADAGPDANTALSCGATCADSFESIEVDAVLEGGLRPVRDVACPTWIVPLTPSVPVDATGKVRRDGGTTAGAIEIGCE